MVIYCKFTGESAGEITLKIDHHLVKLWARVQCPFFYSQNVDCCHKLQTLQVQQTKTHTCTVLSDYI